MKYESRIIDPAVKHTNRRGDSGGLTGWLDGPLAQDVIRAGRLREEGYSVVTQLIPCDITPKNRLLMGEPARD